MDKSIELLLCDDENINLCDEMLNHDCFSQNSQKLQLNWIDDNVQGSQSSDYLKDCKDELPWDDMDMFSFDTLSDAEADVKVSPESPVANLPVSTVNLTDIMEQNVSTDSCDAQYLEGTLLHISDAVDYSHDAETSQVWFDDTNYPVNVSSVELSPVISEPVSSTSGLFTDEYLAKVDTKTFNCKVRELGIARTEVAKLKKRRRTVKNRGYALNCRQKRNGTYDEMRQEIDQLRRALREQVNEKRKIAINFQRLQQELNDLKASEHC